MRKLSGTVTLVGRILLIVGLVGVAWVFGSVQNLFQNQDKDVSGSVFNVNEAHADAGGGGSPPPPPSGY